MMQESGPSHNEIFEKNQGFENALKFAEWREVPQGSDMLIEVRQVVALDSCRDILKNVAGSCIIV